MGRKARASFDCRPVATAERAGEIPSRRAPSPLATATAAEGSCKIGVAGAILQVHDEKEWSVYYILQLLESMKNSLDVPGRGTARGQRRWHVRGGGGTWDAMESRVSALETHMVYVRKDLDKIKEWLTVLPTLATKADIAHWKIQWTALLVAFFAWFRASSAVWAGWKRARRACRRPRSRPPLLLSSTFRCRRLPRHRARQPHIA